MSEKFYVGNNLVDFRDIKSEKPVSKVTLMYDDENGFSAGDDTGLELVANCYFATQDLANRALAMLSGHQYHAYSGTNTDLDPAAELGDGVTVGGVYSVISRMKDDGFGFPDLEAPGKEELEEEFPHPGFLTQDIKNKVTLGADYYGTRITRANGLEIVKTAADGTEKSRAKLNADELSFYDDNGGQALYFDPNTGRYMFRGDIVVTGNINMSQGSITWGPNNPADGSGISASQARTIITEELVSSPTIAGGKFYGLSGDGEIGDTWLEIGLGANRWGLQLMAPGYITAPVFGVYNADWGYTSFTAKGFNFLTTDADTSVYGVYPQGNWDFSQTDSVTGLYLRFS